MKGEVVPTTPEQSAGLEADSPSSAQLSDPLFYPSWYKGQPRQTSNSDTAPMTESRQVGPSIPVEVTIKTSEAIEAATANESSAVSGKEAKTPTAASQVSSI